MKKKTRSILFLAVVAVLVAVPVTVFAGHDGVATATVYLHPSNQSGVMGKIDFTDDGSTLTIHGTASGLTPGTLYASLIYDNKSVAGAQEHLNRQKIQRSWETVSHLSSIPQTLTTFWRPC